MKNIRKSNWVTALLPLIIAGCGGDDNVTFKLGSLSDPNYKGTPGLSKVYTYQSNHQSNHILSCSKLFLSNDSCDVADIKPIGVEVIDDVTIDDIKERLVVSHDWMADSFIGALRIMNAQELLNLFKAVNTIVLSYDVRPSFYHPLTASIYIDPRHLWGNAREWNTIYQQKDYREEYQADFITDSAQRYVNPSNSEDVVWSNFYSERYGYTTRTYAQIAPGLYELLAHELAHANDFLNADVMASIGNEGEIYDYINTASYQINDDLEETYPLNSELLKEAASIAYNGEDMTYRVKYMTGFEAGQEFDKDGAAAFYGYSKYEEDVATLFEAYMMYKKYRAVSDVAFVRTPQTREYTCNDWKVEWGQRARLADKLNGDREPDLLIIR